MRGFDSKLQIDKITEEQKIYHKHEEYIINEGLIGLWGSER